VGVTFTNRILRFIIPENLHEGDRAKYLFSIFWLFNAVVQSFVLILKIYHFTSQQWDPSYLNHTEVVPILMMSVLINLLAIGIFYKMSKVNSWSIRLIYIATFISIGLL